MKKSFGDSILNLCNKKHNHMMYSYSNMECLHRQFFLISDHFPRIWHQKLKSGKNAKKHLVILSCYRFVTLTKIIWCMVPEIWSSTDRTLLSLWAIICPFTSPLPQAVQKKKNFEKNWRVMDVIAIFHFQLWFSLLPPNDSKNEKFKTMKKRPWDIILHKCTKNNDYMLYCSWGITRLGCNSFFHFGQF